MINLRIMQYYMARAIHAYARRDLQASDLFLRHAMGEANKVKRRDFTSQIFTIRNQLRRLTRA